MPHPSYTAAQSMIASLRARRLELGFSQRAVARRAGADEPLVHRWERGDMLPSLPYLIRWAAALGLAVTLQACTVTVDQRGQELLKQIQAVTDEDIRQTSALIELNNDDPARQCLAGIVKVRNTLRTFTTIAPMTVFQAGMDITNPAGFINAACAAERAAVKARVQLFIGSTATLLAAFGL